MSTVYVFGDSHATPFEYVAPKDSFWGLASADMGADKVINAAVPGNSFEAIQHLVLSWMPRYQTDDLLLIGIPVLERFASYAPWDSEILNNHSRPDVAYEFDGTFSKSQQFYPDELERVFNVSLNDEQTSKSFVLGHNRMWWEIRALREIYLLTNLLEQYKNINYLFVNLSSAFKVKREGAILGPFYDALADSPYHILFENTMQSVNDGVHKPVDFDKYGYFGHHGEDGHKRFYDESVRPALLKTGVL